MPAMITGMREWQFHHEQRLPAGRANAERRAPQRGSTPSMPVMVLRSTGSIE